MDYVYPILSIILIDLVLSGDNAVVIGMAAHRLPEKQRRQAIVFGGGAAIVLRVSLTAVATLLLRLQGVRIVGGVLLVWIAFKLLKQEEEAQEHVRPGANLRQAIVTILLADFIMSLDNVIAVAAASHGSLTLLMFGLLLSMAILMFMGTLVANLVSRFWWLSYVGSGVIAHTGAVMVFEDPYLHDKLDLGGLAVQGIAVCVTLATLAFAHWFHRRRPVAGGVRPQETSTP